MLHSAARPRFPGTLNLILLAITAGGIFAPQSPGLRAEEDDPSAAYNIIAKTTYPAPDGSGRNRTTVGVGEMLELTAEGKRTGDPYKIDWTVKSGNEYVRAIKQGHYYSIKIRETELANNKIVKILAKNEYGDEESIELTLKTPASIRAKNLCKPIDKKGYNPIPNGIIGVSTQIELTILPDSVCFNSLRIREFNKGTFNDTGCFKGAKHKPLAEAVPVLESNKIDGTDGIFFKDTGSKEKYCKNYPDTISHGYYLCGYSWHSEKTGYVPFTETKQPFIIKENGTSALIGKFDTIAAERETDTGEIYYDN